MKRIAFLLLAISAIMLSGCKKDTETLLIRDIAPVTVSIMVTDAQRHNLLNPQASGALEVSKIKALYQGQEYVCNENQLTSKAILPRFYGLKIEQNGCGGPYLLRFGELNGAQSYTNEPVTIIWPDGSSDLISFNRTLKKKPNGDLEIKDTWFLNGSEVSGEIVEIIK